MVGLMPAPTWWRQLATQAAPAPWFPSRESAPDAAPASVTLDMVPGRGWRRYGSAQPTTTHPVGVDPSLDSRLDTALDSAVDTDVGTDASDDRADQPVTPGDARSVRPLRALRPARSRPVSSTMLAAGTHCVAMSPLGFGVATGHPGTTRTLAAGSARAAVLSALRVGYRTIDTAAAADDEIGVGRALADTDVPRDEIFLTAKVGDDRHGYDRTLRAFEESTRQLRQRTVDLYLIAGPCPSQDRYVDTWRAILRLRDEGRVRAAGVSDFDIAHLQRLMDETGEAPALNQVPLHPYLPQEPLRAFHARHGIATQARCPLGADVDLLDDLTLSRVAAAHERTPAQIVLRWHLQHGNSAIPGSIRPRRIAEHFDVFDFTLEAAEMAAIDGLGRRPRASGAAAR